MIEAITLCALILAPQAIAGWRGFDPAAHLTLLLLSLTLVSSVLVSLAGQAVPPAATDSATSIHPVEFTGISYAAVGLAILAPLFWAIEPRCTTRDKAVANVLVQTLALCFACATTIISLPIAQRLIEWISFGVVAALFGLVLHSLRRPPMRK